MAFAAARELKVGRLINKTLDVMEKNWTVVLFFIVVLGAINFGMTYLGLSRTSVPQQLALTGVSIIIATFVNFYLYKTLLSRTGLKSEGEGGHIVPFLGLNILYSLGVGLAFIVLILPGLFVLARWSLAQPLYVNRGGSIIGALKQSWERTRGNEFPIIVAALALAIIFLAVSIAAPLLIGRESLIGLGVAQLANAVMSVIFASLGVVLYGLIVAAHDVADTFD